MKILVVNGPNLNLLGTREPQVYGGQSFESYMNILRQHFKDIEIDYFQSNWEGAMIDKLHEADRVYDGVIMNPGGYTHTSVSIADAIAAIVIPVVEVHISHVMKREEFRHVSLTGAQSAGIIMGFGLDGYRLAVEALRVLLKK